MNRFEIIFLLACLFCIPQRGQAQQFLDRLQNSAAGQGSVHVNQSKDINELVNGKSIQPVATPRGSKTGQPDNPSTPAKPSQPATAAKPSATTTAPEQPGQTQETVTPEMRKKVMRNSYKVDGYRVQVFAGGNTRNDKQQAERTGNDIKALFPTEPVYVHFYSPRWICRMGNYRTYEEAHSMLVEVKNAGYKQAAIVKGKISVQY